MKTKQKPPASIDLGPGNHYRYAGEPEKAVDFFTLVIERDPGNLRARLYRLLALDESWRPELTEGEAREIVKIGPGSAEACNALAYDYQWKSNDIDEEDPALANELLSKAIRLDPTFAEAYLDRGKLRKEEGDLEGALEDLSRCLELDPGHCYALMNRAEVWEDLGFPMKVVHDLETLMGLYPFWVGISTVNQLAEACEALHLKCGYEAPDPKEPAYKRTIFDLDGNEIKLGCIDGES